MKIIDKNGKFFGKVSILDIIIVLSIVFIGVVFIINMGGNIDLPVGTKSNIEYTAKIKSYSVEKGMRDPFAVGDNVYSNNGELIGKIISLEEKPMISKIKLQNGTYIDYESPIYVDYFYTVEGAGSLTDKGYFAEGTFALYPGKSFTLSSRYYNGNSVVLSVEKKV